MPDFIHLHCHTEFSLLDGLSRLEPMTHRIAELGMPAVAITDHASMFGVVDFYEQAVAHDLKPIIGCEVYVSGVPRQVKEKSALEQIYHLTLLAMNETGFHNLNKLVSIGYLDGFYRQPRVDKRDLAAHNEGLICLSGCLSAEIPSAIAHGDIERAEALLRQYLDIFGRDRFYLEVQRHGIPEEDRVTRQLVTFAKKYDLKLVASNDSHYIHQHDANIHDILLCIQLATSQDDPNRIKFYGNQFYLKSGAEMAQTFAELPHALTTTLEIAERCQFRFDFGSLHIPKFDVPNPHTLDSYLMHLCCFGFSRRYREIACQCEVCQKTRGGNNVNVKASVDAPGGDAPDVDSSINRTLERLHYEIGIIRQKRLSGYFLIVQDLVSFAKRNDIPVGAGRGSAAGSLVSYLLGITEVDPMRYNLFFERFLNPERVSMPDIDIDIGHRGRDRVFDYISKKYGRDHVAHIATLDTLSSRTVIRDVGRSLGMPYHDVDRIAKAVPRRHFSTTIDRAMQESDRFRHMVETEPKVRKLIETARHFEGMPRHASIHAAGVIITDEPLTHHVALQYAAKGEVIAQMTMNPVEKLGLLKMDLLGLRFISAVREALHLIRQTRGIELSEAGIPLDDEATYAMLREADTDGLFQVESQGMRRMLRQVQPDRIEDIMAVISLFKPGPMLSGLVDQFIACRHGQQQPTYLHPRLEPILADTYGAVLYQEQVMQVAQAIAGYTPGEADNLRRYMGKLQRDAMKAERATFVKRALGNDIDRATAEAVFDMIQHFGGYGFNKAHAAGYGITVYHTAYMKCNYFPEYWTALLNSYLGFSGLINRFVRYARRRGVTFLPPDMNHSEIGFSIAGDHQIRCGIGMIKHLGSAGIKAILQDRQQNGPFRSLYDFYRRMGGQNFSKKALDSLIKAGAFGFTGLNRAQLLAIVNQIRELVARTPQRDTNQLDLFGEPHKLIFDHDVVAVPQLDEVDAEHRLSFERDALEIYVTTHPLDRFEPLAVERGYASIAELSTRSEGKVTVYGLLQMDRYVKTRRGDRMAYGLLSDLTGTVSLIFFPDRLRRYHEFFGSEQPLIIHGTLDHGDTEEDMTVVVDRLEVFLVEVK